jgi:hypothetical protein
MKHVFSRPIIPISDAEGLAEGPAFRVQAAIAIADPSSGRAGYRAEKGRPLWAHQSALPIKVGGHETRPCVARKLFAKKPSIYGIAGSKQ